MSSGSSEENAARSRCCGEGTGTSGRAGASGTSRPSDGCGTWSSGSGGAAGAAGSGSGTGAGALAAGASSVTSRSSVPCSSVFRKSAARGPSRMLARLPLPIPKDLLGELPIRVRGHAVRVVLEDGHALHGSLREADRLLDPRREHPVPEVLLEDLDGLLGVEGP